MFFIEGKMDHNEETFLKKLIQLNQVISLKLRIIRFQNINIELKNKKDKHSFHESVIGLKKTISINQRTFDFDEKIVIFLVEVKIAVICIFIKKSECFHL